MVKNRHVFYALLAPTFSNSNRDIKAYVSIFTLTFIHCLGKDYMELTNHFTQVFVLFGQLRTHIRVELVTGNPKSSGQ